MIGSFDSTSQTVTGSSSLELVPHNTWGYDTSNILYHFIQSDNTMAINYTPYEGVRKEDKEMIEVVNKTKKHDAMENETVFVPIREVAKTNYKVLTRNPVIEKAHFPYTMKVTVYYCDKLGLGVSNNKGLSIPYETKDEKKETVNVRCMPGDRFGYDTGVYIAIAKVLFKDTYDFSYIEEVAKGLPHLKFVEKMVRGCIKEYKDRRVLEAKSESMERERKEIIRRRKEKNLEKKRKKARAEKEALVDTISDIIKNTR